MVQGLKRQIIFLGILLQLWACASSSQKKMVAAPRKDEAQTYQYADVSGSFMLQRRINYKAKKIFFQRLIYQDSFENLVERLRSITQVGGVLGENGVFFRPLVSQIQMWMEGKEFSNQIKLNLKTKSFEVIATGKEKGPQKSNIPLGSEHKHVCFFQQVAECLKISGVLRKFLENKMTEYDMTLVMETYPFNDLVFSDFSNELIYKARISQGTQDMIDSKTEMVLNVEMGTHVINLKFNKNGNFMGMFWVAQGISMVSANS